MAARSFSPIVEPVGASPERVLRDCHTPADATNLLQDTDMEGHLATLRVTYVWQNTAIEAPQNVAPSVSEEEIEDELDMSGDEYIPSSQKIYSTPEDVQQMIEAAFKDHNEIKLPRLIDDSVNKKNHLLFRDGHEKPLAGTYTERYQVVQLAAAKAIYLGRAEDQINNKVGKLVKS